MQLSELTDLMKRSFESHIDGLEIAAQSHGVIIMPSDKLHNTNVIMMVSPSAYEALVERISKKDT